MHETLHENSFQELAQAIPEHLRNSRLQRRARSLMRRLATGAMPYPRQCQFFYYCPRWNSCLILRMLIDSGSPLSPEPVVAVTNEGRKDRQCSCRLDPIKFDRPRWPGRRLGCSSAVANSRLCAHHARIGQRIVDDRGHHI